MVFPLFDLNELPVSPQSPTINSPGLDDLESNDASFFGTNNANVIANEEVDQAIDIIELDPEPKSLELETQGRKKELISAERLVAYECLLERMEEGILRRGSTRVVAAMFGVGIRSIHRLWLLFKEKLALPIDQAVQFMKM